MAGPVVAVAARTLAQAGSKYAPMVVNQANELLKKVTSGRVTNIAQAAPYIGNSAERFAVVARAAAQSGMNPTVIMPEDVIGTDPQLSQIRSSLIAVLEQQRAAYDAGVQPRLEAMAGPTESAADTLKAESVEAVRRVYGSADNYFLCHPNGGVPRSWFTWYDSLFKNRRRG